MFSLQKKKELSPWAGNYSRTIFHLQTGQLTKDFIWKWLISWNDSFPLCSWYQWVDINEYFRNIIWDAEIGHMADKLVRHPKQVVTLTEWSKGINIKGDILYGQYLMQKLTWPIGRKCTVPNMWLSWSTVGGAPTIADVTATKWLISTDSPRAGSKSLNYYTVREVFPVYLYSTRYIICISAKCSYISWYRAVIAFQVILK